MAPNSTDGSETHVLSYPGVALVLHYHHRWYRIWLQAYAMAHTAILANKGPNESEAETRIFHRIRQIENLKPTNREARQYFKSVGL